MNILKRSTSTAATLELPSAAAGTWIITPYTSCCRQGINWLLINTLYDFGHAWCRHIRRHASPADRLDLLITFAEYLEPVIEVLTPGPGD